jgi:hypothetical protein
MRRLLHASRRATRKRSPSGIPPPLLASFKDDAYGSVFRDTGVCASENDLNTNGSGWNNRISSRYRN